MIIVPETSESVFDPGIDAPHGNHQLPTSIARAARAGDGAGALLTGTRREEAEQTRQRALAASPEYRIAIMVKRILDHALVKDAVTRLHQEHEEHRAKLAQYEGQEIAAMVKEEEAFLREQERRYTAQFTDERQRSLFNTMTAEYFSQSMAQVKQLRNRKILDYQREVIGRQNQEFVNRALSPENVFNNELQTAYRDLLLFNLENLHDSLPDAEVNALLDEASRDFCVRIVEKRLELDPEQVQIMLDAPAVRRVLGRKTAAEFAAKAKKAVREEKLARMAAAWVEDGIPPGQARINAAAQPEQDRADVLEHYRYFRHQDNRQRFFELIAEMEKSWSHIAEAGYRRSAIPHAIRRNRPELAQLLADSLEQRVRSGGFQPDGDFARLADLVVNHQPRQWSEQVREPAGACRCISHLGGPESKALQAGLRFLTGNASDEDARLFTDVRIAHEFFAENGAGERDVFFQQFVKTRRIRMERDKHDELDTAEVRALAEEVSAQIRQVQVN